MGWVVISTPRPLYLRQRDAVAIVQKADWVPRLVWTDAKNLVPTGIRSTDSQVPIPTVYYVYRSLDSNSRIEISRT